MRAVSYAWQAGLDWPGPDCWYDWDSGADERVCTVFWQHPKMPLLVRMDNGQLCTFRRKETKR